MNDRRCSSGQLREKEEGETQAMMGKTSCVNMDLERERTLNRSMNEQLQQTRSSSTSPARSPFFLNTLLIICIDAELKLQLF